MTEILKRAGPATCVEGHPVLHVMAPSRSGGLERVVEMLATQQLSNGVHVACVLAPEAATDHPVVNRLDTLGIPTTIVRVGNRRYFREHRELRSLIIDLRPRVVHTHGYRADVIAGMAARAVGIPVVSTVHGFVGGAARNRLNEAIQCFALRRHDAVMAVSSPIVETLVEKGVVRDRISLVRNGYSPSARTLNHEAARRVLGLGTNAQVIGWVGRLSPEKGPDVMLAALAKCGPAWQLSMIGDGPERGRLRELAQALGVGNRVIWHGNIEDAALLLSAFDVFVLSSLSEGTPIVLLEAMHAGVPIIATNVGGVPDVVSSDEAIIVPSRDARAIATAVADIEHRPAMALRRTREAGAKVRARFATPDWSQAVAAVYKSAIARSRTVRSPDPR